MTLADLAQQLSGRLGAIIGKSFARARSKSRKCSGEQRLQTLSHLEAFNIRQMHEWEARLSTLCEYFEGAQVIEGKSFRAMTPDEKTAAIADRFDPDPTLKRLSHAQ